jgi:uncharacterized protein
VRYYVQSAYDIPNEEKYLQETKSLDHISDSFTKVIVVKNNIVPKHTDKGYLVLSLSDFLLNPDSLDW